MVSVFSANTITETHGTMQHQQQQPPVLAHALAAAGLPLLKFI